MSIEYELRTNMYVDQLKGRVIAILVCNVPRWHASPRWSATLAVTRDIAPWV